MSVVRATLRKVRHEAEALYLEQAARLRPRPTDLRCSVCGRAFRRFLAFRRRPQAECPRCGALERHRVLASFLTHHPAGMRPRAVLHFAPETGIRRLLQDRAGARYVACDLEPRHDVSVDITSLPFGASSFDLVVCCHVLEHVRDDAAAMRELRRVTTPNGYVVVQVPWRPGAPTEDDPDASCDERARRFGQPDHVRMYGADFPDRLESASFSVEVVHAAEIPDHVDIGAPVSEVLFVARPR